MEDMPGRERKKTTTTKSSGQNRNENMKKIRTISTKHTEKRGRKKKKEDRKKARQKENGSKRLRKFPHASDSTLPQVPGPN